MTLRGCEEDEDIVAAGVNKADIAAAALVGVKALQTYLDSDKPLSRANRKALAAYIGQLAEHNAPQKRGRPRRNAAKADTVEQAERNAAWLVAFMQKAWRKHHGKERVPGDVLAKMIHEACKAADTFNVPVKPAKVRSALKTGRIVVA